MVVTLLVYCAIGLTAGLLSGLIGIGGGLIIVPALTWLFAANGFANEVSMHYAVGTSVACIVPSTLVAAMAQYRRGNIRWSLVQKLLPGVVIGAMFGAWLAGAASDKILRLAFAAFAIFVACRLLVHLPGKTARKLPGRILLGSVGVGIGILSALLGVGGGVLFVPLFHHYEIPMKQAVATSVTCSFGVASLALLGHLLFSALPEGDVLSYSIGHLYLPAAAAIIPMSMLTAPLGVWLTDIIPPHHLKRMFGYFLLLVALDMVLTSW